MVLLKNLDDNEKERLSELIRRYQKGITLSEEEIERVRVMLPREEYIRAMKRIQKMLPLKEYIEVVNTLVEAIERIKLLFPSPEIIMFLNELKIEDSEED